MSPTVPASCATAPASGAFYPGIVTSRFVATCEFYFEHFGFRPAVAENDHMVLLGPSGARLAIVRAGQPALPAALQQATRGTGIWLNLEVDDPDAVYARLAAAGAEIVAPPEFTLAATRRFIVRDPSGVLVYVGDRTSHAPLPAAATLATSTAPDAPEEISLSPSS